MDKLNRTWQNAKLGDVFLVNPHRPIKRGVVTPYVPMEILPTDARSFSIVGEREYNGSGQRFRNDDTLLARITPCLENGKTAYVNCLKDGQIAHGSTEYIVISGREGISDNLFAYYLVRTPKFKTYAVGHMEGTSGRQRVPAKSVSEYELSIPGLIEQKAIASILGALDDKIEVNQKMNRTLEEIARAIFKSWFVDFDPVRAKAEGRPTGLPSDISDLFPDELVNSELGQIPKGWSSKSLGDILTPKRGKTITKTDCGEGSVPVVAGGLEPAYFHNQSNVEAPVVTVSASGANAGYVRLYHQDIWASDCSYISYKETSTPLLWYIFLKLNQGKIFHMQHGAAQPHIQPSDLRRLPVVFPDNEILWDSLNQLLIPVFSRIGIGLQENKILSQIRDTLLPKLISGEIRIPDAEKFPEETVS